MCFRRHKWHALSMQYGRDPITFRNMAATITRRTEETCLKLEVQRRVGTCVKEFKSIMIKKGNCPFNLNILKNCGGRDLAPCKISAQRNFLRFRAPIIEHHQDVRLIQSVKAWPHALYLSYGLFVTPSISSISTADKLRSCITCVA